MSSRLELIMLKAKYCLVEEEPAWVLEYLRKEKEEALIRSKRELEGRLAKIRAKELRQKQRYERGEPRQKKLVGLLAFQRECIEALIAYAEKRIRCRCIFRSSG